MSWDNELLRSINDGWASPQMDVFMIAMSFLGLTYIWLAWSVPLWLGKKKRLAVELFILIIILDLIGFILKIAFARERPQDVRLVGSLVSDFPSVSEYSFPSGHALRAFGAATLVSLSLNRKVIAAISMFSFAVLVGLSRIYLGAHYPSDVLAGAIIGIAVAGLYFIAARKKSLSDLMDRIVKGIDSTFHKATQKEEEKS